MIAKVAGTLLTKGLDRVEVMTSGGVGYELFIPLSVYETLPDTGEEVSLHTHLVVKEDVWQLFGFTTAGERAIFQRVLTASGVGPALALGMLSTLSADRLVRAIREKDYATLQTVPRVGRKKAEQIVLDLKDKMDDVQIATPGMARPPEGAAAEDAVRALVSLGYTMADAERAVRLALDSDGARHSAPELIRAALAKVGSRG